MSKLETTTRESGGRATVVFAGTLDISTIDQALAVLAEARAEGQNSSSICVNSTSSTRAVWP
jgi:hypothetical protein